MSGKSCWDCVCFHMAQKEFVDEAKCMHPFVRAAMKEKGVKSLDKKRLDKGCRFWASRKKDVRDATAPVKEVPKLRELQLEMGL